MNEAETYRERRIAAADTPQPKEPSMCDRSREILGYISELEKTQWETRRRLSGPYPESGSADNNTKRPDEPCLEEMLAIICNRIACCVGEQKTILNRI